MSKTRLLAVSGLLVLSGCLYQARQQADETACALAGRPYDRLPTQVEAKPSTSTSAPPPAKTAELPAAPALDVQTAVYMEAQEKPKLEPPIPMAVPGSEVNPIKLP